MNQDKRTIRIQTEHNSDGTHSKISANVKITLPIHANNAAALLAGMTAGMLYRTNGDPDTVCVVH
jgi:hypothetical protein